MRLATFGATGRTGVPLVRQALDPGFDSVARADVARSVLDCLEADRHVRAMPKVGSA